MGRISYAKFDKAVHDFAKLVVRDSRANLTKEKALATRQLWASIGFHFEKNILRFRMMYYGKFIDKGVTGTGKLPYRGGKSMPVAYNQSDARSPEFRFSGRFKAIGGDLKSWLRIKGLDESLDYPIRRSIYARGIRPRRFYTDSLNKWIPKFEKTISRALNDDISDNLDDILSD